jgi:amphi-Trp domain-containing protein
VTGFRQEEKISRQQAADRLIDIAYALTAGGTLELRNAGGQVSVPVAEQVLLKRESNAHGGKVTVEVELSWRA